MIGDGDVIPGPTSLGFVQGTADFARVSRLVSDAGQLVAAGRPDLAAQLYATILEQYPGQFRLRLMLADCLVRCGQMTFAAEQYLHVAQTYAAQRRERECLAICYRVLNVDSRVFVYMAVGPMMRRIGSEARVICAKAAEAHMMAGLETDGLQMLKLGVELDPHNVDVRRQLAQVYLDRHMQRDAVELLSEAAELLLGAGNNGEYIDVAEQILMLDPGHVPTLRELPRVYLRLGEPHRAVKKLGVLMQVSPGDIVGFEILAQAFAVIGRVDKSLSVLSRLVHELAFIGQSNEGIVILRRARRWRSGDEGFLRALDALKVPRPKPKRPIDALRATTRDGRPDGTVVLSIAEIFEDGGPRHHDPSIEDASIEILDATDRITLQHPEGTVVLQIEDLLQGGPQAEPPVVRPSGVASSSAKPPAVKPRVAKPPAAKPRVAKPPVVKPPVVKKPPVVAPSSVKPPAVKPPAVKPPAVKPPAIKPPAVKPPAIKPSVVASSSVKPRVAKPPVVKPPVVKPPTLTSSSVKPPVVKPATSKPPAMIKPPRLNAGGRVTSKAGSKRPPIPTTRYASLRLTPPPLPTARPVVKMMGRPVSEGTVILDLNDIVEDVGTLRAG